MYKALGFGKGDTILAVVAIVIGCPAYVHIAVPPLPLSHRQSADPGYFGIMGSGYGIVVDMRSHDLAYSLVNT